MKTTKLYAVQKNEDQTEGRGPMTDVYYTTSKELALKIVTSPIFYGKYGVQGCPPYKGGEYDIKEKEFTILENLEDFFNIENNLKIKNALSKLSEEEKQILGLK